MAFNLRTYYPQQDIEVRYLDDDPALAARYHPDQQLAQGLVQAAKLLSNVWVMGDDKVVCDWMPNLFSDRLPETNPGSMSAFIGKKRIYPMLSMGMQNHLHVIWAAQYGGNYQWLWRMANALVKEFAVRGRKLSKLDKIVANLSATPPRLQSSVNTWCEPHFVGVEELNDESTVTAYRRLIAAQVNRLTWTPELPEWLESAYMELHS